jgi:hypothetical protein
MKAWTRPHQGKGMSSGTCLATTAKYPARATTCWAKNKASKEGGGTNPATTNVEGNPHGGGKGESPGQLTTTMLLISRGTYPLGLGTLTRQWPWGDRDSNPRIRDQVGESRLEFRPRPPALMTQPSSGNLTSKTGLTAKRANVTPSATKPSTSKASVPLYS